LIFFSKIRGSLPGGVAVVSFWPAVFPVPLPTPVVCKIPPQRDPPGGAGVGLGFRLAAFFSFDAQGLAALWFF